VKIFIHPAAPPAPTTIEEPQPSASTAAPASADAPALPSSTTTSPPPIVVVRMHVESKPPGARVIVAGQDRGQTPLDVHLPYGKKPLTVEIQRQGYAAIVQSVTPDADQKVIVALTRDRRANKSSSTSTASAPPAPPPPAPSPTPTATASFRRFD